MKYRKSKSYLIISSSHLGISDNILQIFGNVASTFKASVYHLGEMESKSEYQMIDKIDKKISSIESKIEKFTENTKEDVEDRACQDLSDMHKYRECVVKSVKGRLNTIKKAFKNKVTFVVPSDSKISGDLFSESDSVKYDDVILSKYIILSAIQPVSDVSTIKPTNRNVIQSLKQYGSKYSWVVPHPVPSVIPFPRPGLNNAHNYYTVGGLKDIERPTKRQNVYLSSHSPSAILLVVDSNNEEFHAVTLHVDYIQKNGYKRSNPVVLYDGLCFTPDSVKEITSSGRAVFVTDEHEPYYHAGVLGATRTLNSLFQPETFINGGDASDCEPVSRHILDKPGALEGLRLCDMFNGLQKLLKAQTDCKSIKNRILIDSNHHDWVTQFAELHPQLMGMIDWGTISKTQLPEWNVRLRQGEKSMPYKFGDYTIRHGDQESFQRAELIFENGKYLCGHWHRHQAIRRMVSVGCGCGLNPPYMKNKENDWQNQITSLTMVYNVTAIAPKIVLHSSSGETSRFLYRNEIIETKAFHIK